MLLGPWPQSVRGAPSAEPQSSPEPPQGYSLPRLLVSRSSMVMITCPRCAGEHHLGEGGGQTARSCARTAQAGTGDEARRSSMPLSFPSLKPQPSLRDHCWSAHLTSPVVPLGLRPIQGPGSPGRWALRWAPLPAASCGAGVNWPSPSRSSSGRHAPLFFTSSWSPGAGQDPWEGTGFSRLRPSLVQVEAPPPSDRRRRSRVVQLRAKSWLVPRHRPPGLGEAQPPPRSQRVMAKSTS